MKPSKRTNRITIVDDAWVLIPFGLAWAAVGTLGLAGMIESDAVPAAAALVVGLAIAAFGVRRLVRLFRPPSRERTRREARIRRRADRLLAHALGFAMALGGMIAFGVKFLRLLRSPGPGASRFEPFLWLPVAAFGIAVLGIVPSPVPHRARPEDAFAPALAPVSRSRRLLRAFLPLFPGGLGAVFLAAALVEAEQVADRAIGFAVGCGLLALGAFLGWRAFLDLAHNVRSFVRVDAPRGPVEPGKALPVRLDISPTALVGATRLLARPYVALFEFDEKTPWLAKTPEGLPADDAAAWFGPAQLDVSDPAAMRHATFGFRIPDMRTFSRRERFNPLADNVEWRLEILLFRNAGYRRQTFRVRIAQPACDLLP